MSFKRKFIVGEKWLYVKIYSGPKFVEDLLLNEVAEVVNQCLQEKIIHKFFFVRYTDEGYHLRVRFLLTNPTAFAIILTKLSLLLSKYVENRLINKLIIDTYNREIERYSPASIEQIETIFHVDSLMIIEILKLTQDYDRRWLWGIKLMDTLLEKFDLVLSEKYEIYETYYQFYSIEFNITKSVRNQLKLMHRKYKNIIENTINTHIPISFNINHTEYENAFSEIKKLKNDPDTKTHSYSIIRSIVHMHFNRLFRTRQRTYELAIYYMLSNVYKSMHIKSTSAL